MPMTSTSMDPETKFSDLHEPWLKREQAAEYLGIHPNTLDSLRRDGKIHPLYITSRVLVYELSELERFTREQRGLPPLGPVEPPPAPEPQPKPRRVRDWNAPKQ